MFGVTVSTKKPRAGVQYEALQPQDASTSEAAGISIRIVNTRKSPVYLKWRI